MTSKIVPVTPNGSTPPPKTGSVRYQELLARFTPRHRDVALAIALWGTERSIPPADAARAIVNAAREGISPLEALLTRPDVSRSDVARLVARSTGVPYIDLSTPDLLADISAIQKVGLDACIEQRALPIKRGSDSIIVAADPASNGVAGLIHKAYADDAGRVTTGYCDPLSIDRHLARVSETSVLDIPDGFHDQEDEPDDLDLPTVAVDESSNVAWAKKLLDRAAAARASDLHFEMDDDGQLVVEMRVDGELRQQVAPSGKAARVINALLQFATMDIGAQQRTQSTKLEYRTTSGTKLNIRAELLPTIHGPKITWRLLDPKGGLVSLDQMGLPAEYTETLRRSMAKSHGLIITTGPTGSGKALALSTRVPTPDGFTTMGEITVGQEVLGRDGRPCRVEHVWDVNETPELFQVTFSDGQQVIADADHQWLVADHYGRNAPHHPKRVRAVEAYESAHRDADRIDALAEVWGGPEDVTVDDLLVLLDRHDLTRHIANRVVVHRSLDAVDCPRRAATGRSGAASNLYPADIALKSLALRLRQRFSSRPVDDAVLYRMTTMEMVATGLETADGQAQFAVPVAGSLDLPDADLPVDPYVLGCGLTGTAATLANVPLEGTDTSRIPAAYLRGSQRQRLALLQGLMDHNGSVDADGHCVLSLSDDRLADDAIALVRTLGIKAHMSVAPAGPAIPAEHRIHFTPTLEVFRGSHRAELAAGRITMRSSEPAAWLYVTAVEPVTPEDDAYEPARCITVDSPDRTYLVGDGYLPTSNSTTQYGLLEEVIGRRKKIITIEDPVEYTRRGITQVQVNLRAEGGVDWASAIRSCMRSDPDVLLIGETRDPDTAQSAVQASMTGHLVLTTLHTTSALGVYSRLMDLGVESSMIADQLTLSIGQRLVSRLHERCRREEALDNRTLELLGNAGVEGLTSAWMPGGCELCDNTGYQGRAALMELLKPDGEMRAAVMERRSEEEMRRTVVSSGNYLPFYVDGTRLLAEGVTSPERLLPLLADRNASIVGQ